MSTPKVLPFKAKAEERAAARCPTGEVASGASAPPSKKACTAYEKQLQKMDGDVTLIKDIMFAKVWFQIAYAFS